MLLLLISFALFLLFKLKGISKNNIHIFLVITIMWMSFGCISITVIKPELDSAWETPVLLAMPQFIQSLVRFPVGVLSQKIQSRKNIIIGTSIIMIALSIPLIFIQNFSTLIIAAIGMGVFASTYGLQNQYWSETWNIRNVFITIGIILISIYIGKYTGAIINSSTKIYKESIQAILISSITLGVIIIAAYSFFVKEDKNTILLDNQSSYSEHVSKFKIKEILIFSSLVFFIGISISLIQSNAFINSKNEILLNISILTATIFSGLFVAFILVRKMNNRHIEYLSILISILGFIMMLISSFAIKSEVLTYIGVLLITIGGTAYIINQMGMILHIDHKNSLLVLGIWLSFKSLSFAIGTTIGGEVALYSNDLSKYLIIVSIGLLVIALLISKLVYRRYTIKAYELTEQLEYSQNHIDNQDTWNSRKIVFSRKKVDK